MSPDHPVTSDSSTSINRRVCFSLVVYDIAVRGNNSLCVTEHFQGGLRVQVCNAVYNFVGNTMLSPRIPLAVTLQFCYGNFVGIWIYNTTIMVTRREGATVDAEIRVFLSTENRNL